MNLKPGLTKKTSSIILVCIGMFMPLILVSQHETDPLSGRYQLKSDQVTLTLELNRQAGSIIKGTLSSSDGIRYSLEGIVEEGVASGLCSDDYGSVFFELYAEGSNLVISLIEPDVWNMPDYSTATILSFERSQGTANHGINKDMNTSTEQPAPDSSPSGAMGAINTAWGFQVIPPEGWKYQESGDGMIMGHTIIPGMILIFPHTLPNLQEIGQEMAKGLQEEGFYLMLDSQLSTMGNNMLAGDYQGMMDGQRARARGFGTLSPYGGGAFILAVSTPEKLGEEITRDAEYVATNIVYTKTEASDLFVHFAGPWTSFTKHTSTTILFYADGIYDEQYESSYSGKLDGGGHWGHYSGENAKGRWTVQGTRDQGRIHVRLSNGNEIQYDYQVHEEQGKKYYSEYWFNGKLYGKSIE